MDQLLCMLSTTEYISGETLCQELQMTRGAIWKRMEKLRAQGYQIISAGKKGYRLEPEDDSLLPGYILHDLRTKWAGRGEICYELQIGSTNTYAKDMAHQGAPHGSLAVCHIQTAGKGRLSRGWDTPHGDALTQSMVLRPKLMAEQASLVTLAAAVAVAQAVSDICPTLEAGIKWPNDVVLGGKKFVGILCELSADIDGIQFIIPGVGINVNQQSFSPELKEKATSMLMEMQKKDPNAKPICRRTLLCAYLKRMEDAINALEEHGLDGIMPEYLKRSVTIGRQVRVIGVNSEFIGTAKALDPTGALIVTDEGGNDQRVLSGDVSVRGLMGYV
ncbi:MAG: biotin--[acetyl-CoA-carboxylase] ligase [Clostridiales bacterium]|nr:biotin--[acetyl-CoA-carboxylase] ligase [Clostridiales bacterium]